MRKLAIIFALLATPAAAQVSCYDGYYSTDCYGRGGQNSSTYYDRNGGSTTFYRDSEGNNRMMNCYRSGRSVSCY